MGTAISARGIIQNPKFQRLEMLKIVASESGLRTTNTSLVGIETDGFAGGLPVAWSGSSNIAELTPQGISRLSNTTGSTVYLGIEDFLNLAVEFEIVQLQDLGDFIIDFRRVLSENNYCYRLVINSSKKLFLTRRDANGNPTIKSSMDISIGDVIRIKIVGAKIDIYINGQNVSSFIDSAPLMQSGKVAISKGTSSGSTIPIIVKNLKVYEVVA